jgi:hypothetical protein
MPWRKNAEELRAAWRDRVQGRIAQMHPGMERMAELLESFSSSTHGGRWEIPPEVHGVSPAFFDALRHFHSLRAKLHGR